MKDEVQFRSGFISIVGRPNVGKSTLLNTLLGQKIAIISDKPQTTRNRIQGMVNRPGCQMVFIDTPGIHKPVHRMNEYMVKTALGTYNEVDVVLFLVEATSAPGAGDKFIIETLAQVKTPVFLLINKVDLVRKDLLLPLIQEYSALYKFAEIIPVSAIKGELGALTDSILKRLPEGPQYFPDDQLTDQPERFIMAELIREKIFTLTKEEIPYSTAVMIEQMKEEPGITRVDAVIYVERDSQKGIIIGKGGEMLKKIGTLARQEAERLLGVKLFLQLWVKVKKGWREDDNLLRSLGIGQEQE
ncbi:MAG: GTPase Era [Nitrospirae bacterium GWC2_57_13]|jgi:GTPase|nr:MAG: GTPase Era [Nitrospirae bacterium GWC1_57_7]OGW29366.1 MAG: GTPase Era [Nitrospirae bacterium GWC2_57_13]HAR44814.1 GTPase Era [Nitrospiraceae bacterium]